MDRLLAEPGKVRSGPKIGAKALPPLTSLPAKVRPEAQPRQRDTNWSKQTLALFQSSMRYNEKVVSVAGPDHGNTPPPLFLR